MDSTIGTAYIQIEPSTKGIKGSLSKALGDEGSDAGASFTSGFGKVLKGTVIAGVAYKGLEAGKNFVQGAVDAFGNYEQLKGGVETLFAESSETVMKNAANAFKTAGMSANEYMQTVTSFAASLKQSTATEAEAAKAADMAVIDMADNANKMGTSMESIQNAYMGFSKQNYTMLDNLKLGYGGTKSEMERLLADATKLTGVKYDINNLADVYNAIHAVQQELGITGTTAIEADGTIQGSAASIKAAWENVLTGMGDSSADLSALISELANTAATFAGNMMPVISQALNGLVQLISEIVPVIAEQIPQLLPQIVEMLVTLVQGLSEQLPTIINYFVQALISCAPIIINALPGIMKSVVSGLLNCLPLVINGLVNMVVLIVKALPDIINAIIADLPNIIALIVKALIQCVPQLIAGCITLVGGIVKAIPQIIVGLKNAVPGIIQAIVFEIVKSVAQFKQAGGNLLTGLWQGMSDKVGWLKSKIKSFCSSALDAIKDFFGIHSPSKVLADEVGEMLPAGIAVGIDANLDVLDDSVKNIQSSLSPDVFNTPTDYDYEYKANSTGSMNDLYNLLNHYLPQLANMQVVMDTGATVGVLATPMNNALGKIATRGAIV